MFFFPSSSSSRSFPYSRVPARFLDFFFLKWSFFLSVNNQRLNWLENAITFHLTAAAVAVAQVLRDDERTSITEESNVKMRVKSSKVELKIGSTAK